MWLVVSGVLAIALYLFLAKDPPPIFGKYSQPGPRFWIKYAVFRLILMLRQGRSIAQEKKSLKDNERTQNLGEYPMAFDAVFFIAVSREGLYILVATDRKQRGVVNGFVYILIPGLGLLRTKEDVIWFGGKDGVFGAEGVRIEPLEPMRKWRIEVNKTLFLKEDPTRTFSVKLDAVWSSRWDAVNFGSDMSPHAMAKSFATEPWSREYFQSLKAAHQNHQEQVGRLRGTLEIDKKVQQLNLMSWRDRSFGPCRDWSLLHRYALFMIFLEDGTFADLTFVNQPSTCTSLQLGYLYTPEGKIHPVEWTDFLLYQHGEGGSFPHDLAFTFKAGGTLHRLKMKVVNFGDIHIGWRWEAKVTDRMVTYEVNGVKGRGVSEVQYSTPAGRPPSAAATDPDWFTELLKKAYAEHSCGMCQAPLEADPHHHHHHSEA